MRSVYPNIPNELKVDDPHFPEQILNEDVVLDIGCGSGSFMVEYVPKHPEKLYIGIEIWRKRANKTAERLAKRGLDNFRVIPTSAQRAFKSLFPPESVSEAHINFPTPWLRDRQWKNRLLKPSLLIDLFRILKPNGSLNFVTDVDYYAEEAADFISRFPGFVSNYDPIIQLNLYPSYPTLFFEKMSPVSDIHYLSFRKDVEDSIIP